MSYYGYSDQSMTSFMEGMGVAFTMFLVLFISAICVFFIICQWKLFEKAGKPGWASLIPIYNYVMLLEVIGLKWYYIFVTFLSFIPMVGGIIIILFNVIVSIKLSKSFGKDVAFGIGIAFLNVIFYGIIAFDKSINYIGPTCNGDLDFNNLF